MNVLLNGGKAKLIGHRPATSQRPKKRTKESSCQTTGLTIRLFCSTVSIPRTPLKKVHLLGCARSHRAKELFKPFNTFRQFKTWKNTNTLQLKCWTNRRWSIGGTRYFLYTDTPSIFFSLYVGERGLEWSQVPEVIHLEVLALDRAGETVEFQVIFRRSFAAAIVRENAVLNGLLVEG